MKVAVGASSFSQSSDKALRLLEDKGIEVVKNPYGREPKAFLQDWSF